MTQHGATLCASTDLFTLRVSTRLLTPLTRPPTHPQAYTRLLLDVGTDLNTTTADLPLALLDPANNMSLVYPNVAYVPPPP
jgi:hypothetical protein